MSSIRNVLLTVFCAAPFSPLAGCRVDHRTPPPEPLNAAPLHVDAAMQRRDWDPSVATYKNDTVMAFPDYAPLRSRAVTNNAETVVTDTPIFLVNVLYIPVGIFIDPPFKMVGYKSLMVEPTYTAMPPQKPATQPSDYDIRLK
jgi:hypothetical protein